MSVVREAGQEGLRDPDIDLGKKNKSAQSASASTYETTDDIEKNIPSATSIQENDGIYDRFTPRRKRAIVAVVAFAALLARTSNCPLCSKLSDDNIFYY